MGISNCESSGSGIDVRRVVSPGAGLQAGEQPWVPGVAGTQKSRASHPASDSGPPWGGGWSAPLGHLPSTSLPTKCPSQWDQLGQGALGPHFFLCRRKVS